MINENVVKYPEISGKGPENEFPSRAIRCRLESEPISCGMGPERRLLLTSKTCRSEEQVRWRSRGVEIPRKKLISCLIGPKRELEFA